jgi:predicted CXXCH cytochrome family protein
VYPLKREGNEACTVCHEAVIGQRVHQHGGATVACTACHDPHASDHTRLLRAESTATLCQSCHPAERFPHPHGPFGSGECVACHEPHESDFVRLLRGGEGAEHCFLCHEETHDAIAGAAYVHEPAGQDCRTCHEPHGADHPHSMRQPVDRSCFECHPDVEELVAGVAAPHGALSTLDRCANCHDAHASNQPKLLKDRQDVLCLSCHDKPIVASDGRTIPDMRPSLRDRAFQHGPVESGNCSACHNIHGGSHSRLLTERFTEAFYASFDLSSYALCFECHAAELVTEERTEALTDFRNGDVNLHYLHVNRQTKGRTCRACHEMHGSDLPAHVAESVPFEGSGWQLPIGFIQTETGGSCAPGCHRPMGYDRVDPLPPPAADP